MVASTRRRSVEPVQTVTSLDMCAETGSPRAPGPPPARARTASRSEKMPAKGGCAPVTTSAPMRRSARMASASAIVASRATVATSRPLASRMAETFIAPPFVGAATRRPRERRLTEAGPARH